MPLEELTAGVGLLGVIAYGVLGGADFGGGIWDLFASGPRRDAQRQAILRAMGPVWEANHVWLIFVIVVLFSAFPPAFAALSVGLFGLFHFVLLGITLRGAAFAFRGHEVAGHEATRWGTLFGIASVITPVMLGMAVGAVSSGNLRVHEGQVETEGVPAWLAPVSVVMGLLALSLCAYLAAVFLTLETSGELREDFRQRALFAGTVVVALSGLALPLLYGAASHLWDGLISVRAAPVLAVGIVAALCSGWALWRRQYVLARAASVVQIALLLLGWGLAQFPYLIYPDITLYAAASPETTLRFVLVAIACGTAVLLPSLWLLFRVFKTKVS